MCPNPLASRYSPKLLEINAGPRSERSLGVATEAKLSHTLPKRFAVLAGLGLEELTFSNAVRPGDELVLKVRVLEKIESKSKQDRGVIRTLCEVLNQNGEIVFRFIGRTMVARRTDLSL